jgi:hypothetical protein
MQVVVISFSLVHAVIVTIYSCKLLTLLGCLQQIVHIESCKTLFCTIKYIVHKVKFEIGDVIGVTLGFRR